MSTEQSASSRRRCRRTRWPGHRVSSARGDGDGGGSSSYEAKPSDAPGDCVIVIYTMDDHTIHKVTMCEVRPLHYELSGDTVIGHW